LSLRLATQALQVRVNFASELSGLALLDEALTPGLRDGLPYQIDTST
jgi:hypothetical protein